MLENRRTLQSTLLLQKKREMQAVQAMLEKKRVEFAKRMEECREKQEEVAKFEKFLKENDAKRQRANAKAATEKKLRELKEVELGGLQKQLQEEQAKSASILKLINKNKMFERYLQSIVDILPPDYLDVNEPHINDIIMRHGTLVETNEDLKSVVQKNQDDIEKLQSVLAGLIKEKNDLILVFNSKLGTQQKHLDKLKLDCAYLEQRLEERDNTSKERMRILSETKLAIDDLFDRISVRTRSTKMPGTDPAGGTGIPGAAGAALGGPSAGDAAGVMGGPTSILGGAAAGIVSGGLVVSSGVTQGSPSRDGKTLAEKLHAIQYRVLDLQDIAGKQAVFMHS
nr:hypothetical protein HK105_003137 [Polyrhizophydium stewartii]